MIFGRAARKVTRKAKSMIDDEERKKRMLQAAKGAAVGGVVVGAGKAAGKMMSHEKLKKGFSEGMRKQLSEIGRLAEEKRKKKKRITGFIRG